MISTNYFLLFGHGEHSTHFGKILAFAEFSRFFVLLVLTCDDVWNEGPVVATVSLKSPETPAGSG